MIWLEQAACRGKPTAIFFPEGPQVRRARRYVDPGDASEAKKICGLCPVRVECLTYAVENREHHGIWGGVNEKKRARIRAAS